MAVPPAPHPASPGAPPGPSTSTRGPKALTFTGVGLLVLTVAAAVAAGVLMWRIAPTDVLTSGGEDGPAVVASVPAPGSTEVGLAPGDYAVWLVVPSGSGPAGLDGDLTVTDADGDDVRVGSPSVSGSVGRPDAEAQTVGAFTVTAGGEHLLEVPAGPPGARVVVTPDQEFASFFGGLMTGIGLIFLAVGLGLVGLGVTAGGAVWWYRRRNPPRPRPGYGAPAGYAPRA